METLIVLWIKWTRMLKIKHKDFIDAVPTMPSQNSSWIMGFRIYGERRTQISLSSSATISPLARIEDRQGIKINTDIKIANYTKSNHIMVSFTDHYNAISIDRLPSKTKIGKVSWNFNNSVLCKPEFSSATKTFLFLLKNKKKQPLFSKWPFGIRQISFYKEY